MPGPKSSRARALETLAALLITTSTLPALAQPSRSDDLFHEGKALMDRGQVAEACEKFAESVALLRRGGALLNLAVCRAAEGRYATALRLLEEARDVAVKDGRADRVALAEDRIDAVRSHLSWLTVRPAAGAAGPDVAIACDGEDISGAAWGTPRAVDPGPHTVVATAPRRIPFQTTIVVGPAGDTQAVEVPPLAVAPSTAILSTTAQPPDVHASSTGTAPPWRKPLGWAGVGVGAAAVAVGSAFGVKSVADSNASKSLCPDDRCDGRGYQKNQAARAEANVANVAISAGLVAAVAGICLLLVSPSVPLATAPRAAAAGSASLPGGSPDGLRIAGVAAAVGPGAARIVLQSTW